VLVSSPAESVRSSSVSASFSFSSVSQADSLQLAPLRFRRSSSSGCWCFPLAARCPARDGLPSCENKAGAFDMRLLSMGLRNTSLSPAEASASAAVVLVFLFFLVCCSLSPAHSLLLLSWVEHRLRSWLCLLLLWVSSFREHQPTGCPACLLDWQGFESSASPTGCRAGLGPGARRKPVGWLWRGKTPRWGERSAPPRSGAYAKQEGPDRALKTHLRCN
jgi:hypothetical protein